MRRSVRDDLVPVSAIVAGTVVAIVVTAASLVMFGGDTSAPPSSSETAGGSVWIDPRGPERGPGGLEWEVIRTYKAIESMTAHEPSREIVDRTLEQLRAYGNEHPDNPFIQELYLKGLRVAQYYAAEADDEMSSVALTARFEDHAARFPTYRGAALESIRLAIQRLEQSCDADAVAVTDWVAAAELFPGDEEIDSTLQYAFAAADRCDLG